MPFPEVDAGPGMRRRVLAHAPGLMVVAFRFEAGAEGTLHDHPNVRSTYVASSRFAFTVAGAETEVGPGDSFVIPSMARHGCICRAAGTLIDGFTPRRDDLL